MKILRFSIIVILAVAALAGHVRLSASVLPAASRELSANLLPGQSMELSGDYLVVRPVRVPRGARLHGSARLSAQPGSGLTHFLEIESGASVEGLAFDGSNLTPAVPDWVEDDGPPRGVAILVVGKPDEPVAGARISRCKFEDFPNGAVFARHTADLVLAGLEAMDMQQRTSQESCAVFAAYDSSRPLMLNCWVAHYRWKAFYFKRCNEPVASNTTARHGPDNHASHYARFCRNVAFLRGGAEHAFGVKTFGSEHVRVEDMVFNRCSTGIFIDASSKVIVRGNRVTDSSGQGIIVGSEEGYSPASQVRVVNNHVSTSVADMTANSSGVQLVSMGRASPVVDVEIAHNEIGGYLWAVGLLSRAGAEYDNIRVLDNRCEGIRQYGMVGPVVGLVMRGNRVALSGAHAQRYIEVWPARAAGTSVLVEGNTWVGARDYGLQLGRTGLEFSAATVRDNRYSPP